MPLAEPFDRDAGFQMIVGQQKNFWIMDSGSEQIAWGGTALQPNSNKSKSVLSKVL
ncbi:hypothetical protein [Pleurocapsa sp. FMAR1]|uniref:hypothetical protein n=1 Tax=Pleurocapsa sp. FMAR1 TaxID=3040204 RepID=UPI0029C7BC31|nr:hypothetical protein [Pleurocapsa sp. FMAR1]